MIIQLQKTLAAEMRRSDPSASIAGAFKDAVKDLNVELKPLHPTVRDEVLETYFVIFAPDQKTGDEVARRLRNCEGVEAAYVKPLSEEPS